MNWVRRVLAYFARSEPTLPPKSQTLHDDVQAVRRALRDADVRIVVVPKNRRALDELRRLQDHARR